MTFKNLSFGFGKLLICGLIFFAGLEAITRMALSLGLQIPLMAPGAERNLLRFHTALLSPLLALALVSVAQGIGGSFARGH